MVRGPVDDLAGHLESDVRVLRDTGLVVRDCDHGGAVLGTQRQHPLHLLVLAGHRVDQGLALIDSQARLEGLDDRGVDREWYVDE